MMSRANSVKGQGVGSAYEEQLSLVRNNLSDIYQVGVNQVKFADIRHYHTINLEFLTIPFTKIKSSSVGYVHFLPETLENSIRLPKIAKRYFINM